MLKVVPLAEEYCRKTIRHMAGEPGFLPLLPTRPKHIYHLPLKPCTSRTEALGAQPKQCLEKPSVSKRRSDFATVLTWPRADTCSEWYPDLMEKHNHTCGFFPSSLRSLKHPHLPQLPADTKCLVRQKTVSAFIEECIAPAFHTAPPWPVLNQRDASVPHTSICTR